MSIQHLLRMRATVRRNVATGENPYGGIITQIQDISPPLKCYCQAKREITITDDGKLIAVTTLAIWTAREANVQNEDTFDGVRDLRGVTVFPGIFRVTSLVRRENHAEGILEQYG